MKTPDIIKFRDMFNGDVVLYPDNSKIFDSTKQGTHLIWDDANESVTGIKLNHSHYELDTKPLLIERFGYDVIQYMGHATNMQGLINYLVDQVSAGLLDQARLDSIVAEYIDILDIGPHAYDDPRIGPKVEDDNDKK